MPNQPGAELPHAIILLPPPPKDDSGESCTITYLNGSPITPITIPVKTVSYYNLAATGCVVTSTNVVRAAASWTGVTLRRVQFWIYGGEFGEVVVDPDDSSRRLVLSVDTAHGTTFGNGYPS
jgi:hypothetical protein